MPEKSHTDKVNLFAGKMPHGIALLMFLAAAFPQQSYPLEIFLNDNRSETGTIGFIDIDKVFSSYSGTASSKKMFEKEVKRK